MIIDRLKNASLYFGMSEGIETAFSYLQSSDMSNVKSGRYEIDGSNIYAVVQKYETKHREDGLWEAHRQYIDVQYIIKGIELIGYANIENLEMEEYDDVKDRLTLKGDGDFFVVRAGTFVIFTPQDAHMPGLTVNTPRIIEKIVLKVKVRTK
jgi:YhcH/YjgK/YiaL family protein